MNAAERATICCVVDYVQRRRVNDVTHRTVHKPNSQKTANRGTISNSVLPLKYQVHALGVNPTELLIRNK